MNHMLHKMVFGTFALVTLLAVGEAQAQSGVRIGIGLGGGGVRVGVGNGPIYGPGYYGPGYGMGYGPRYGYYGPGYGSSGLIIRSQPVYVPQPVYVQPQPVYVQPQPGYTPGSSGLDGSALPSNPTAMFDGGEILLFSPTANQSDVRYTLNGHLYTMPPGTKQRFKNDRVWTIEFESSPGQVAQYTLTSARYKFKSSGTGLSLFQTQDTPETSNAAPSALPRAPVPNPPEDTEATVIPSRPALKTTP